MKRVTTITGIILIIIGIIYYLNVIKINEDKILQQIIKSDESSIVIFENGKEVLNKDGDDPLNIASIVKWFIAIEFADQVEKGIVDPNELVKSKTLNRFYVEETDGGARRKWLDDVNKNKGQKLEEFTLEEVMRGMMIFSSNANTDFLIRLLGIENINHTIKHELGLTRQEPLYSFTGALLIPEYLSKEGYNNNKVYEEIKKMNDQEYQRMSQTVLEEINNDTRIKYDFDLHNKKTNRLWEDRLPKGTASELAVLMEKIRGDQIKNVAYLKKVLNRSKFGNNTLLYKEGNTERSKSISLFYEDQLSRKISVVVVLNNLNWYERKIVNRNFYPFIKK